MRLKETKDAELVRSSVPIAGENDGYVKKASQRKAARRRRSSICELRLRAAAEYDGGRQSEDDRAGRPVDDQLSFFTLPAADVHLSQSQPAQWDAEADRRLFFYKSDNQPGSMRFSRRELLAHGSA